MRPKYETEEHLKCERMVAKYVSDHYNLPVGKTPEYHFCDYEMTDRSETKINMEIKCRTFFWGQYPTVILSRDKWDRGVEDYVYNNARFIFVVRDKNNSIRYFDCSQGHEEITFGKKGGRTDRNDPKDIEEVVHIPTRLFLELK